MTALSKDQKQIAIIGGGPGGLTLALILQNYGIQTTIYEREIHDKSLERGGSLDIHEETVQKAFKEQEFIRNFKEIPAMKGKISDFLINQEKLI